MMILGSTRPQVEFEQGLASFKDNMVKKQSQGFDTVAVQYPCSPMATNVEHHTEKIPTEKPLYLYPPSRHSRESRCEDKTGVETRGINKKKSNMVTRIQGHAKRDIKEEKRKKDEVQTVHSTALSLPFSPSHMTNQAHRRKTKHMVF
jgi:hypothetical protein